MKKTLRIVECAITGLSKTGLGLGSIAYPADKTSELEVAFTMPGDKVTAVLGKKEKGIYQGRIEQFISKSPDRAEPRCIHFSHCGGCRWQHIPYEEQLRLKQKMILDSFAPHLSDTVKVHPIIPSDPWNYRNKMELSFSGDKAKNRFFGLFLYGSRGRVFNMQECHLSPPWFIEAVKAVDLWWAESGLDAYHPSQNAGSLRTLILREGRRSGDRLVMLTVSGNPEYALHKGHLDGFVAFLRDAIEPLEPNKKLSIFLRIQQIAKGRPTQFYEMVLYGADHIREQLTIENRKLDFKISPSAFFQPNTEQAERLYSHAFDLAVIPDGAIVYDLYCGTGTLGICAAHRAKKVVGIELSPESVVDARENIKLNGLSNVEILQGDVGQLLSQLKEQKAPNPDVVLVDPPRAGLDGKVIQHLLELKAPTLVYISCNPTTQSANLEQLLAGGYRLETVQPVDQFPQTLHVENIAILRSAVA